MLVLIPAFYNFYVIFLFVQVCHYLMAGQVKSVKPCLKQLQQSIQTIMSPNWPSDEGT